MTATAHATPAGMPPVLPLNRLQAAAPARCTASDVLRWTGMGAAATSRSDAVVFATRRVRVGTPLVHEGSTFESLYFIGAGTFKCSQTDLDGGEQVQEFAMKGDALGLEGICSGHYGSTAVALEDSTVAMVPFRTLVEAGHGVPVLEKMLHCVVSRNLMRRNRTMQLMVTVGADVRVARFLLDWAQRQGALGFSTRRLRLRMTRIDIASHLGVAHETVSRSFTALAHCGLIRVSQREVEIVDEEGLQALHVPQRGAADARTARPSVASRCCAPLACGAEYQ